MTCNMSNSMHEADASSAPPAYSEYMEPGAEELLDVKDGRINIELDSKFARVLGRLITEPIEDGLIPAAHFDDGLIPVPHVEDGLIPVESIDHGASIPEWDLPLNIVIQVVGSRGDVQPFVALGNELQRHGHRVRLATHGVFEQFVREQGLEFYPIGGDPTQLMAYMVKNPGLIPGMKTLSEGEIQRKRGMIAEMLDGCWKSCLEPDTRSHIPFVARAIIANPVSFAHIHCGQALAIPVHLMFTMPWTRTRAFPHPLANVKNSKHEPRMANYLSYAMVEWMTWQGIGGVVNAWRKSLELQPVPTSEGPWLMSTLKVPHTYCWSAALVPRPRDWPSYIDVCGFFFRQAPKYTPPPDLEDFLSSGDVPIYIGFGSIVIDDPTSLTRTLLEAVERSGVRAIISRGWSRIGSDTTENKNVFYLDDCPHEWLFQRVRIVVHHGGAGTTACGLLNARPTIIVPFFGDQPFWGQMIARAGAGPPPIPYKLLTSANLAQAIISCLSEQVATAALAISHRMRDEDGVRQAVASFHRQLPRDRMSCNVLPAQPATWLYTRCKIPLRLSNLAVENLCRAQTLKFKRKHLKHYGPSPIVIQNKRWDPVTGLSSVGVRMATDMTTSTVGIFADPVKVYMNSGSESTSQLKLHGQAALAFAKSIDHLALGTFKAGMVDIPLAMAEGFRNVPRLWGQNVKEQQEVNGWQSGVVVAGKVRIDNAWWNLPTEDKQSLAYGFYDGVGGFFYKPYRGARDEGMLGLAKGCGKALTGIVTEPVSGAFGVFGYTGDGIAKSLDRAVHRKTMKQILRAKQAESEYLAQQEHIVVVDDRILQAFNQLLLGVSSISSKPAGKQRAI